MVKRALTLLTSILIALSLLMPFNIYASGYVVTGSDVVIGVNADIYDYDKSYYSQLVQLRSGGSSQWLADSNIGYQQYGIYRYEFVLNKEYLGYIWIKVTFPSGTTQSFKFYVNGNKFYWYTKYDPVYNQDMATKFQVTSVSLVEKEDNQMSSTDLTNFLNELIANQEELIESTGDIFDKTVIIGNNTITMTRILNEFYQYVSVYQKNSLDTIISYIDYLNKHIPWNFPVESLSAIGRMLNNAYILDGTYELMDYHVIGRWTFPLFATRVSDFDYNNATIYPKGTNAQDKIYFVVCTNSAHVSYWNRWFTITQGGTVTDYQTITRFNMPNPDTGVSQAWGIYRYTIQFEGGTSSKSVHVRFINNPTYFIPIYWGYSQTTSLAISTDFALQFGLQNEFLENIDVIVNGTAQSSSAAQSSDSANEQLQTDSNTLFQQENGFKSDMQNAMQNVNNTFRLQDMGTKFVSSAQWVRTQYEQLTNNTPFASLITFSLITGLALILLGKVYK